MTPNGMLLKATQVSHLSPVATPVDSRVFCAVFCALLITKLHKPSAFSATGIRALLKQSDKKLCAENLECEKCQHVAERGKFLHGVNGISGFFFQCLKSQTGIVQIWEHPWVPTRPTADREPLSRRITITTGKEQMSSRQSDLKDSILNKTKQKFHADPLSREQSESMC